MQSAGFTQYGAPVVVTTDSGSTNGAPEAWVLFVVDEQKYALQMWEVERIVRAVEVTPLPEAPPYVLGVVNVQGRVLPVIDLRVRFGQPSRAIRLEDHFIIAQTPTFSVILPVDAALGSVEVSGGLAPRGNDTRARCLRRVMTIGQDVVYVLDLERVVFADQSPTESDFASILAELRTP